MEASLDLLLIDVPERIHTERLILRCQQPGDGAALNAAVSETLDQLAPWMPWAQALPSERESEAICRRMNARFRLRQDLTLFIFERRGDDAEGDFIGEAVRALTAMAFDTLAARRVDIRMDAANAASRRVAERCGFALEGVLKREALTPQGEPRDTCVYARVPEA